MLKAFLRRGQKYPDPKIVSEMEICRPRYPHIHTPNPRCSIPKLSGDREKFRQSGSRISISIMPYTTSSPFFLSLPGILFIVVTQIRGDIAGSTPPSPLRFVPCIFYREKISALSSLVDSRRIVPTHAINRRSQQFILLYIFANKFRTSPRRDSISRTSTFL